MARQLGARRVPHLTPARRLWWSSLPLRMIAITLSLALIVLVAGGMFLMQRVGDGILTAKRQSSVAEATAVVNRMQTELEGTDLRTSSLYERLTQLADEAASPTGFDTATCPPSPSTTRARTYCTPVAGRSRVSCSRVVPAQAVKSSSS